MTPRWTRFASLKKLADTAESRAAKSLAESLQRLEAKQDELDRFRAYAAEYEQTAGAGTTDPVRLRNLCSFTRELATVIRQLETDVDAVRQAFVDDLERWQHGYRRSKALEQLVASYRREYLRIEALREQKEADELASSSGRWSSTHPDR
jgi:flagellar export protein FliJ